MWGLAEQKWQREQLQQMTETAVHYLEVGEVEGQGVWVLGQEAQGSMQRNFGVEEGSV